MMFQGDLLLVCLITLWFITIHRLLYTSITLMSCIAVYSFSLHNNMFSYDLYYITGKPTSFVTAAVGIIVVVLILILCLSGFMWFR